MTRQTSPSVVRPRLPQGGSIGVAAPAYAVPAEPLRAGIAALRRRRWHVVPAENLATTSGYLAGDDSTRLEALVRLWTHPEVDALWFARGGYGVLRLLDDLPWRRLSSHPKLLIGYSDIGALQNAVWRKLGWISLSAPVVTELGDRGAFHGPSLRCGLVGRGWQHRLRAKDVLAPGQATGPLLGGNLCVLTQLLGTRFMPDTRGAVLLLEEIGERLYRIDRMLTQLRLAGALSGLAGVILGHINLLPRTTFPPDRQLDEVLAETFSPLGIPVVRNFPIGHCRGKRSLPIGGTVRIDTQARRVDIEPSR